MLETLIEIAPLLAGRRPPNLRRPGRVAVVTTTGGGAATVVDRLGLHGIECVAPGSDSPIIDLTMAATQETYRQTLETLLASPECDAVLSAVGSSAQFHPQLAVQPIVDAKHGAKPLAAFFTPHAERSLALLAERGIPASRTPEACADALAAYFSWRTPVTRHEVKARALDEKLDPLSFFAALGIPVAKHAIAHPPGYAHAIAFPVALKRIGIAHKTDVGGVILDVANQKELKERAGAWPGKKVLVQEMHSGLAEAIVGYRRDPAVGPVVLVGAGGTLAELYNDYALRLAPVSEEEAEEMIAEVKGLAPIRGYRNLPRGDVRALAAAVARFSTLCALENIEEAEMNPLIVKSESVVAVDGLLVRAKA
jgi:acetate---CoA ligase (ADP-forming)